MSDTSTVTCVQCGSAVPRNSPFCLVCGTPLASRTHAAAFGTPAAPDASWRPAPAEEPIPRSSVLRAEYGWRVLAWFMDYAITAIIGLAVTLPIVSLGALQVSPSGAFRISIGPLGVILILLAWYAYPIAMLFLQSFRGFSLGMLACGLRVVSIATLRRPGLGRILVRDLVVFAGRLVFGIGELVVYLSPLWDSTRRMQGWHDKAAKTWLIDVRRGPNTVTADPSRLVEDSWEAPGASAYGAPGPVTASPYGTAGGPVPTPAAPPAAGSWPAPPAAPTTESAAAPIDESWGAGAPAPAPSAPAQSAPSSSERSSFAPSSFAPPEPPIAPPAAGPAAAGPAPVGPARVGDVQPTTPIEFDRFTPPPLPESDPTGTPALIDSIPGFSVERPPVEVPPLDHAPADLESTRLADSAPLGRAAVTASFTLDSGEVFPISAGGVIGRDPVPGPEGVAIRLPGDAFSVSKTHLEFGFEGSTVWVLDRNSTNGSSIVDSRGFERVLASGQREVVADGDRVRIGTRSFTVRTGLRSA